MGVGENRTLLQFKKELGGGGRQRRKGYQRLESKNGF